MNRSRNRIPEEQSEPEMQPENQARHGAAGDEQAGNDPAGNEPAGNDPAPNPGDTDPVAALRAERDQLHNQLQRTLADLQNFRKRRVQEMTEARRSAVEALVSELLPVLDNFHLATTFDPSGSGAEDAGLRAMREGLLMVRTLLEDVFQRYGVVEIEAAGAKFDPSRHEAVGVDPDPAAADGIVSRVMQKGYTIDGKILRPSRVLVGGTPNAAGDGEED